MKKIRAVILGDILYDCFIWADHLPRRGETVTGYANGFYAGGKGANQAVQAARLHAETYMIGKVGDDERGVFLLNSMRSTGILTERVLVDPGVPTGTCCVHVDRAGNNAIIVAPMANDAVRPADIEAARGLIESADVFICQLQLHPDTIAAALTIARNAGVRTVFNPAPAKRIAPELFRLADYCTPNETEAEFFTGCYQADMPREEWLVAVTEKFLGLGAGNLIVTLGASGAWYAGTQGRFLVPPFPVDAVDSTAAGDSFNAAFALRLAQGASVRDAIAYGNAAGALTTSRMGSQPSMPTEEELRSFLADRGRGELCPEAQAP